VARHSVPCVTTESVRRFRRRPRVHAACTRVVGFSRRAVCHRLRAGGEMSVVRPAVREGRRRHRAGNAVRAGGKRQQARRGEFLSAPVPWIIGHTVHPCAGFAGSWPATTAKRFCVRVLQGRCRSATIRGVTLSPPADRTASANPWPTRNTGRGSGTYMCTSFHQCDSAAHEDALAVTRFAKYINLARLNCSSVGKRPDRGDIPGPFRRDIGTREHTVKGY